MMATLAEQEFAFVAAQLTDSELQELDARVVNGDFTGYWYVNERCGCFFGTIGIMRGELGEEATLYEGIAYRDKLLQYHPSDFAFDDADYLTDDLDIITALETHIINIRHGSRPENDPDSAWLHDLLQAEITRRQAAQS